MKTLKELSKRTLSGMREIDAERLVHVSGQYNIVFVDRREPEEQAVSMIEGAITSEEFERDMDKHRGRNIVVYCTIGARSGAYARQLKKRGVEAINLKGGIIAWTHASGKLVDPDGNPTRNVHTYGIGQKALPKGYVAVY